MKLRLELLPGAITDMDSIWDYSVEQWGLHQAQTYLGALNARMRGLLGFPLMGVAQDWLHPGLRRVGEGSHSIYYLPTEDAVLGPHPARANGCDACAHNLAKPCPRISS